MIGVFVGYIGVMLVLSLLVVVLVQLYLRRYPESVGDAGERKVFRVTLVVSLAVAFAFQASTPKLLEELSTDRDAQENLFRYSVAHFTKVSDAGVLVVDQAKVVGNALVKFQKAHPEEQFIQNLGAITSDGTPLATYLVIHHIDAMGIAIDRQTGRTAIDAEKVESLKAEFLALVVNERYVSVKDILKYQVEKERALPKINIGVWGRNLDFYVERPSRTKSKSAIKRVLTLDFPFANVQVENVLGTFVTALLLGYATRFIRSF